ncbi:GGDEF domain-containing protein [Thalassiella azotivora]
MREAQDDAGGRGRAPAADRDGQDRHAVAQRLWLAAGAVVLTAAPVLAWTTASPWPAALVPPWLALLWSLHRRRTGELRAAVTHAQEAVRSVTVHDELTGCVNEAGLHLLGNQLLQQVRRHGEAMQALVVDVNDLAAVNERVGREAGDEVLVAVAEAVRACTRGTDVVSRGRADEMVVVGPGCGVHPGEVERRVRAYLVESPPVGMDVWSCRVTVGQAVLEPWDGDDVDGLVRRAYQDLHVRTAFRGPSATDPHQTPPRVGPEQSSR